MDDDEVDDNNNPRPIIRPRPESGLLVNVPRPLSKTFSDVAALPDDVVVIADMAPTSSSEEKFVAAFVCEEFDAASLSAAIRAPRPRPAIIFYF